VPPRRLILFAKEPAEGRVKTRLARVIGPAAVVLYRSFLEDLARELVAPGEWEAVLATGDEPGPVLHEVFARGWRAVPQGKGDLGERLIRAFTEACAEGMSETIVVGSDAPTLSREDVREAFAALSSRPGGVEVVFAPALDGGYSLVGLRRDVDFREVFSSVRWSTAHALADTRANAVRRGYGSRLLGPVPDVDVAADLPELLRRLNLEPDRAPFTRRALAEIRMEELPP
jgi:hypothetical protein